MYPIGVVWARSWMLAGTSVGSLTPKTFALSDGAFRRDRWQLQYAPSASRWVDPYLSAGIEWDERDDGGTVAHGVVERGIKFRADVNRSPLKFLGKLTDFRGLRLGLKSRGMFPVSDWRYVIEFGAGTF